MIVDKKPALGMGKKKTVLSIAMLSIMRAPRESHYLLRFEINLDLVVVILDYYLASATDIWSDVLRHNT